MLVWHLAKDEVGRHRGSKPSNEDGIRPADDAFIVYLVDDDVSVLRGLSRLIEAAGIEVRAFESAHAFLSEHDPQAAGCAIVDMLMPELHGLEVQRMLRSSSRPLIFLTGGKSIADSVEAMKAGAIDVLTKPVDSSLLFEAINNARTLYVRGRQEADRQRGLREKLEKLTPRELEVLRHVIGGRLNKQIANDLGTVEKTIKVHRGRVFRKLGVQTVADLVRFADAAGITPITPPAR